MKAFIVTLALLGAVFARADNAEQFRPASGFSVYIGDFEYVAVTPGDWTALTNEIALLHCVVRFQYQCDMQTDAGRRKWHGPCVNRIFDADAREQIYFYADGYTWTDRIVAAPRANKRAQAIQAATNAPQRVNVPGRVAEMRERMRRARDGGRTVNATFGPGGKILKAEESK